MFSKKIMLERFYDDENKYEICLDEAGRGCLFGRVYIAAVVLPKDSNEFDGTDVKDSKKFHSKKKNRKCFKLYKRECIILVSLL